ncbi:SDR family NAD(P)-dependent oxidoreductase [Legionella sp. W05-934-2]|jgi:short-subunit dehydrogenase|uniref:SDR family NAD(P)-dependent oxidoreductase n=1 Tax=Legionella sp. W05-934-2 TaxID=1198649 RepID=UPI003461D8FD
MSKTVFISGCSTGIGLYLAKALSESGYQVIASCRKDEDVKRLQSIGLYAIQMDVNRSASIKEAVKLLLEHTHGKLDVLINNAGFGQVGALEDISRELMMNQFQTNVFGLHELTTQIIPIMRAQGSGRIINISSILGLVSLPFRGAYNASKYAVEALSDTLRLELEPSGIWVTSIQPGPIDSQFRDTAVDSSLQALDQQSSHFYAQYQNMMTHFKDNKKQSKMTLGPDAVFKKVIHAIESSRPRPSYAVTKAALLLIIAKRILPKRWLHRLLASVSKKELSKR